MVPLSTRIKAQWPLALILITMLGGGVGMSSYVADAVDVRVARVEERLNNRIDRQIANTQRDISAIRDDVRQIREWVRPKGAQ